MTPGSNGSPSEPLARYRSAMASPNNEQFARAAEDVCAKHGLTFGKLAGSGSFKHTFLTTSADNTPKAVKIYKSSTSARIEREVSAIQRCNHPNIVRFDMIGKIDSRKTLFTYTIEEYISGGTLSARLAQGPLEIDDVKRVGKALISAISHIETLDLVHRDIKPDNIMLRKEDSSPVLLDFGLVRDLQQSSLTKTWAMQGPGTPYYASPEQLNNEKHQIDWRTDQFALGVVLTICGMGYHPYDDRTTSEDDFIDNVAKRDDPTQSFVNWAKKNSLEQLVRMVQPWSVQRYRTPGDLAAAWAAEILS